MLNDARVASLGFFKYNICTTRINKEKKFKIKFQVLLKFAQILLDYIVPKGTTYVPLVADLYLFCYERDFIFSFQKISFMKTISVCKQFGSKSGLKICRT